MKTSRIETLADGVFAIVMTLLVFEMRVPEHGRDLAHGVLDILPNFLAYLISFVILGVYWVGHHSQFLYIRRADQNLMWLNIAFLMFVSLIPFSAGLLGRYGDQQISVMLYGVNLIVVSVMHYAMWRYATDHGLTDADIDPVVVGMGKRLSLIPMGIYTLAIGLALLSPLMSIVLYTLVPVPYIFGLFYRFRTVAPE